MPTRDGPARVHGTAERWETVGRCDEDELCNGITAVQYMVCKTWLEAIPLALAWVTLIEIVVAFSIIIVAYVLCRPNPCSPFTPDGE